MGKSWFKILLLSVVAAFVMSGVMQYHHHDCSHEEGSEDYSFCLFHILGHGNSVCSDESQHDEAENEEDCPLKISKASVIKHSSIEDDIHLNFVFVILDLFHSLWIDSTHEEFVVLNDVNILLPDFFPCNTLRGPPSASLC